MTRKEQAKIVDKILAMPRRKRWQHAVQFYFSLHPHIKAEDDLIIQENKKLKAEAMKATATNKTGTMRLSVSMHQGVMEAIQLFDSEFLEGDDLAKKRDLKVFSQVFPQYSIPREF